MKKFLNICLLTQEYPPHTNYGGIAVYYNQLTIKLVEMGHHVTILTRFTIGCNRIEKDTESLKILRIGLPSWVKYFLGRTIDKLIFAEVASKHINKLDKKNNFDVIETTETYFEGLRILNNKKYLGRTIVQSHGSNSINVIPKGFFSFIHKLDFKLCHLLELKLLKDSKVILVPSEIAKNILTSSGVCKDKIHVIYHGINTDQFIPLNGKPSSNILNVLFAGKLHKMKGVDFIWKVMNEIGPKSSIHFNFVGDIHPSEYSQVKFYLEKYSDFSSYLGHVKHTDMNEVYNANEVLLLPSRFEQFGLVYAEAMSSGLIVFAGKNGGGSEIINNNKIGYVIDPENDIDFVSNKLKEIASNVSNYKDLKINSRSHILKHFSNSIMMKKKLIRYYDISSSDRY